MNIIVALIFGGWSVFLCTITALEVFQTQRARIVGFTFFYLITCGLAVGLAMVIR